MRKKKKKPSEEEGVHLAFLFFQLFCSSFFPGIGGSFAAILFETDGYEHNELNGLMAQNDGEKPGQTVGGWLGGFDG